jgi:hypothetical protein
MTTTIKILNEGPKPIKIEIKGRNADGQFTASSQSFSIPGTFDTVILHDGQSVQVFEATAAEECDE